MFFHLGKLKPVVTFQQAYEPSMLISAGIHATGRIREAVVPRCSLHVLQHDHSFDCREEFVPGFIKIHYSWFQRHCASLVLKSVN